MFVILPAPVKYRPALFSNIDILHYIWLSSEQTSAQIQEWRRSELNLSIFYSNDSFIVLLLCSDVVFLLALDRFIGSIVRLERNCLLSIPKRRLFSSEDSISVEQLVFCGTYRRKNFANISRSIF